MSQAWPNFHPRIDNSPTWVEISIAPDGSVAFGEALAPNPPHAQVGPAILDRRTGAESIIRSFTKPNAQVLWIVGDASWVVWVEGSLQPTFGDWVLYSFNRQNHEIRTLAAAPKPYQSAGLVVPAISDNVVVWSAVENSDGVSRVYSANADGSNSRVLKANANAPEIAWPWVVYNVLATSTTSHGTLVRENLQTGSTDTVAGAVDISYYAFDGEALAWISADTTRVFLQSPATASPRQIFEGPNLQFISLSARLVGWGQDQGAVAYDRKLGVAVQLSNLSEFYPAISAHAFDWLYQPNPSAPNPFSGTVWAFGDASQLP